MLAGGCGGSRAYEEEERVAREDVLRLLRERGGRAGVDEVYREVGELAEAAVRRLEREGLVRRRGGTVELTVEGSRAAEEVYRRHVEVEERLKRVLRGVNAHDIAHFAEHLDVDPGMLEKLASCGRIVTLDRLGKGGTGRILGVLGSKPQLVARLYGVGLLPGRRVRVLARGGNVVVVEVGGEGRVAALDADVASRVLVVAES